MTEDHVCLEPLSKQARLHLSRWFAISVVFVLFHASVAHARDEQEPPPFTVDKINGFPTEATSTVDVHVGDEISVTFHDQIPRNSSLFLNDQELAGAVPRVSVDHDKTLLFTLARTDDNAAVWRHILGPISSPRDVSFVVAGPKSAGTFGREMSPPTRTKLHFRSSSQALFWSTALMIAYGVVSFIGVRAGMLLDAGSGTSLSLGRFQMFVWTTLVIFGFLLIWSITGDADTVTSQCLVLMGISAATAMGARPVDASRDATMQKALVDQGTATAAAADAVKQQRYGTGGYFLDLLEDADGVISLHRMQILVWTLVLAAIFAIDVWRDLAMPQFSDTLLALMGVSGGTYVGFKFQEAGPLNAVPPGPTGSAPPARSADTPPRLGSQPSAASDGKEAPTPL